MKSYEEVKHEITKKTVHKVPVWDQQESPVTSLNLPSTAIPLDVAMQGPILMLWYIRDLATDPSIEWEVVVAGTGHPLPAWAAKDNYVGLVQDGGFIWHVFMRKQA